MNYHHTYLHQRQIGLSNYIHTKCVHGGPKVVVVPTLSLLVTSQVVITTASSAAGGIMAASTGNIWHVALQSIRHFIVKFLCSIWSYSSMTADDGEYWFGGFVVADGTELSLWLAVPSSTAELSDWRPSVFDDCVSSRYIKTDLCVWLYLQMHFVYIHRINAEFWIWIWSTMDKRSHTLNQCLFFQGTA